jgi:dTDP-4-amino-4,6-dideoxygalactose transaminase
MIENSPTLCRTGDGGLVSIPLYAPFMTGQELVFIRQLLENGRLIGDGAFTRRCHEWLEGHFGCPRALLTHSGTAALEMAAMVCRIMPGDEVIMPSFTFSSTANAFVLRGATPVFIDVRPDTLVLDENLVEAAITPRTRAVVPVHYGGFPCAMDSIMALARRHGLFVIEDAAHAFLALDGTTKLGTIGQLGCFSFHESKNVICGEGGALMINDPSLIEAAEIVREKGTNRPAFMRGEVDKYSWIDIGSSYLPSDLQAAFLLAQFNGAEAINASRRAICARYGALLAPLAAAGRVTVPRHLGEAGGNGHLFYLLMRTPDEVAGLVDWLKDRGIAAATHYVPLHSAPAGRKFGRVSGTLPVTDDIVRRLLRLPVFPALTDGDILRVVRSIFAFFGEDGMGPGAGGVPPGDDR